MASPDGVAENVDDSASPSLGFNLSRRQEELMKKAERLMRAELDDILEVIKRSKRNSISICNK